VEEFQNCYFQIGGFTYYKKKISNTFSDGFVCAEIVVSGNGAYLDLVNHLSLEDLQSEQADVACYLIPLFILKDRKVEVDLRRMPNTGMVEAFTE
jgi:hypothetical protein